MLEKGAQPGDIFTLLKDNNVKDYDELFSSILEPISITTKTIMPQIPAFKTSKAKDTKPEEDNKSDVEVL